MQKAANWVRGWVEVEVSGAAPEEFFNLCAQRDLEFWQAVRRDAATWTCRVAFFDYKKLRAVGERSRCQVKLLRRGGLPGFAWRLRYRYALLAGLAACLGTVGVLSRFVLTVRVSGNVEVPTGAILTQLRAQGVRPGVYGPGVDVRQVCHGVILELPKLSWMTINIHGTVADVLVREGYPRPELVEEDEPAHIVARYPGIVTRVEATSGQQLVEKGDTVAAGDTLIGSWVDFVEPVGYNGDMGGMTVRATGRVWARTWHTLRASTPLGEEGKVYTGREKSCWSLEILGREVKFYRKGGIPYSKYDKITAYHTARLPGGGALPLTLKRTVCREYDLESRDIDRESAQGVLQEELTRRLEELTRKGEVLRTDWAVTEARGLLTVTLLAECEQEIGLTVED